MQSYTIRDSMLDPIEQSLYRALNGMLCQRALLFTKINLSDLFTAPVYSPAGSELGALAHQRVDFVLCDRDSMRPLAIILFADNSPLPDQIAQLCADAGLPVVRLERQPAYFMHQLAPIVETLLTDSACYDDFSNGDRLITTGLTGASTSIGGQNSKRGRKQPAYPGYGALRTIANKLV
jgi:hypothetical protein